MITTPEIIVFTPSQKISFDDGLAWQNQTFQALLKGGHQAIWLGEHESVVTLGKTADPGNVLVSEMKLEEQGIQLRHIDRGGDVTWHGPGQLVGYPIINLVNYQQDLHWYLRQLEEVIILALSQWGIKGETLEGKTGTWIHLKNQYKKIASIGVHVSRWVTKHGFSFNINPDLSVFQTINACGLSCQQTSLSEILQDSCPSFDEARHVVTEAFSKVFDTAVINESLVR